MNKFNFHPQTLYNIIFFFYVHINGIIYSRYFFTHELIFFFFYSLPQTQKDSRFLSINYKFIL